MSNQCKRDMYRWKSQEQTETDIRIYKGKAIQWQGDGTYYFIPSLKIYCRIKCIEVLDNEMEKGTSLVFIKESDVKEI